MISKLKRLKHVGKFYDYSAGGNGLEWHKNTFLFAPNAYGKSTLVNVLRSLKENDPDIIKARKTLDKTASPEAVVIVDGANHIFNGTGWNNACPNIHVFDAPYIHDNILSHEVEHSHRKNMHRIIIGEQGIQLATELAALKTQEKAKNKELADLDRQFSKGGFPVTKDQFLAIPSSEESAVGDRIKKLEKDIKSKQSETKVRALGLPSAITSPSFDLATAKELAGQKLAAVHKDAEKQVIVHIEKNFKQTDQARAFIRQGLDLKVEDCPFCGQNLKDAASLLKAYQEFFDDSFREYQKAVSSQVSRLKSWNIENELTAMLSAHNSNVAKQKEWEPYIGAIDLPDISVTVEEHRAELRDLLNKAHAELEKKQKDPNADAKLSAFDDLSAAITALGSATKVYTDAIAAFKDKAKQYRDDLPASDEASLKAALAKEKAVQDRFLPEWKTWATDYPVTLKAADDLAKKKEAKQKELEDYGKTIFTTYQKRINELLKSFMADFEIVDLKGRTDERANESYSEFGISILKKSVPLKTRQNDAPCFSNTLSEGDKSTLAFAFFIAAIETLPDLDKQIVVLDDPLSSLDETRREATARLLLTLSPKLKQLCVFTHKKNFLYMLVDKLPSNVTLEVRSDKTNGSSIEPLDVAQDRKGEHAKTVEALQRYVNEDYGPRPHEMQGNIRKLFEVVLKTKYYHVLKDAINDNKGLKTILGILFEAKLLDLDTIKDELYDICNLADDPHHGTIVDAPDRTLSRPEVIGVISTALKFVEKV